MALTSARMWRRSGSHRRLTSRPCRPSPRQRASGHIGPLRRACNVRELRIKPDSGFHCVRALPKLERVGSGRRTEGLEDPPALRAAHVHAPRVPACRTLACPARAASCAVGVGLDLGQRGEDGGDVAQGHLDFLGRGAANHLRALQPSRAVEGLDLVMRAGGVGQQRPHSRRDSSRWFEALQRTARAWR